MRPNFIERATSLSYRLPRAEYSCAAGVHDTKSRMRVRRGTMTRERKRKRFRRKRRLSAKNRASRFDRIHKLPDIRLASDAIGGSIYLSREISVSKPRFSGRHAAIPIAGNRGKRSEQSPLPPSVRIRFLGANVPQR